MQFNYLGKGILAAGLALFFLSCSKTNTQGRLVPKEAAVVITIDGKALSGKLPWEEIRQNPLFQEMQLDSSMPAAFRSLLENPETAGMDIKADCLIFVAKDSSGGYIGFEGKVNDETKFQSFNKQVNAGGAESEKDGAKFISKFPVCVGWTKDKFVYVFDAPQLSGMDELSRRMMRDSITIDRPAPRDVGATCKAVFALAESNSLAKTEKFSELMKKTGDVHLWMNSEELIKNAPASSAIAMANLDKFYKGNVTSATMNFENGRMVINAITYAGGELIDLIKKYSGGKVNEDMIRHMPGKDIVAVMALNYNPAALSELIKMTGMDGLINMGLKNAGFTLEDFIRANKGDLLIGVSDLVMQADSGMVPFNGQEFPTPPKPKFNFVFATSIGDRESFNKLINAGKKLGGEQFSDPAKAPVVYNSNANWFVLSNNKQTADQYLGNSSTDFDFIKNINGQPYGGFLNIQALLRAFGQQAAKDSVAKTAYDATLQTWETISWKGGNYSDGGIEQTGEITLVDKNANSLKQLNQYLARLAPVYREKRRKDREASSAFEDLKPADDSLPATTPGK